MKKQHRFIVGAMALCIMGGAMILPENFCNATSAGTQFSIGDVDQSGMIDAVDATSVLVEYASLSTGGTGNFTESQKSLADVNSDGFTDAVDATRILQYYAYVSTGGTDTAEVFFGVEDTGNSVLTKTVLDGRISINASANNYTNGLRWATTVKSYLYENSMNGLTRVENINGIVIVEEYSENNSLVSSETLEMPLSTFGGFYSGSDANYLVFGQSNTEESNDTEVLRIVKYSKDWQLIDSVSAYGCNTVTPFSGGSLRMTETDSRLYIHTAHTMYTYADGLNHQANMTFVVDKETMEIVDSSYGISNNSTGYVSHSFNQFIVTDGEFVYRCDHGDAHPRGIMLSRITDGDSIKNVLYKNAFIISGNSGANDTGVSVGGIVLSENNCLVVGNSVDMDNYSASGQRNIFLSVTDKELNETSSKYLTDYTSEDGISPKNPQIVKVSEDMFLIMWEENSGIKALTVDGDGNITQQAVTFDSVRLSDCQPVVTADGLVKWYVSDYSSVTLYSLNPDNLAG